MEGYVWNGVSKATRALGELRMTKTARGWRRSSVEHLWVIYRILTWGHDPEKKTWKRANRNTPVSVERSLEVVCLVSFPCSRGFLIHYTLYMHFHHWVWCLHDYSRIQPATAAMSWWQEKFSFSVCELFIHTANITELLLIMGPWTALRNNTWRNRNKKKKDKKHWHEDD